MSSPAKQLEENIVFLYERLLQYFYMNGYYIFVET